MTENDKKTYCGWYSKKQHINMTEHVTNRTFTLRINCDGEVEKERIVHNCSIYLDNNDKEVVCTEITKINNSPTGNFDDYICLGIIKKFIKSAFIKVS